MPSAFTPLFAGEAGTVRFERQAPVEPFGTVDFAAAGHAAIPDTLIRQARARAEADGFAAGRAEGLQAAAAEAEAALQQARAARDVALAEARAEVGTLLQALRRAAADLESDAVATAAELADELVDAVGAVCSAALGHELRAGGDGPLDAVRRAAAPIPAPQPVTVVLSKPDADLLRTLGVPPDVDGRPLTVVADPDLSRGDALATSGATRVEARLAEAVDRALQVLRS